MSINNALTRLALASVLAVLGVGVAAAHEGHDHKIMGTVSAVHAPHLTVKTTEGKTETIEVKTETRILRGKTAIGIRDLKIGDRVVVNVGAGKAPLIAKDIAVSAKPRPVPRVPEFRP